MGVSFLLLLSALVLGVAFFDTGDPSSDNDASNDPPNGLGDDPVETPAETIVATEGADLLTASERGDLIDGLAGDDTLIGGAGSDSLDGGDGADSLDGGAGNDVLAAGLGDTVIGGEGNDSLSGNDDANLMFGGSGQDTIEGFAGVDTMSGGDGNDILVSGAHSPLTADHDIRHGGGLFRALDIQGDVMDGGAGNDTLYMGPGGRATGGDGADEFRTFAFVNDPDLADDPEYNFMEPMRITDFEPGEDQLIIGAVDAIDINDPSSFAQLSYDAEADQTTLRWGNQDIALLDGRADDLIIVYDEIPIPDPDGGPTIEEVVTADGAVLTDPADANAALEAADIIIGGYESTNYFVGPYNDNGYRGT